MDVQRTIFLRACLVMILASLLAVQPAPAGEANLSGFIPPFGDVVNFALSPDGEYVVYLADQDQDEVDELYSVPVNGTQSPIVKLNLPLPLEGGVLSFRISPDSTRVAYMADADQESVYQLFSVPIQGPAQSGVLVSPANSFSVNHFEFTPNSQRLVFIATDQSLLRRILFSVSAAGPAYQAVRYDPFEEGQGVHWFQISSDSSRLVFETRTPADDGFHLFSALASEESPLVQLNPTTGLTSNIGGFRVSPAGNYVIYTSGVAGGQGDLYSVPIAGPASASLLLNPSSVDYDSVGSIGFSSDGSRVVYGSDIEVQNRTELYSAPVAGPAGTSIKISHNLAAGASVKEYVITPDGPRAVYQVWQIPEPYFVLYSTPLTGPSSAAVKLDEFPSGSVWSEIGLEVCSDSSQVVYYKVVPDEEGGVVLYSIPTGGPASARVQLTPILDGSYRIWPNPTISPDCSRVAYVKTDIAQQVSELYLVPIQGPSSAALPLTAESIPGQRVEWGVTFTPDGDRLIFRADREMDEVYELYLVDDGQAQVSFAEPTIVVAEGAETVSIPIEMSQMAAAPVTVELTATFGTAGASDLAGWSQAVTLLPGETAATATISIADDQLAEGDETLHVTLVNPQNALLGPVTTVQVTIGDNDWAAFLPFLMNWPAATGE